MVFFYHANELFSTARAGFFAIFIKAQYIANLKIIEVFPCYLGGIKVAALNAV